MKNFKFLFLFFIILLLNNLFIININALTHIKLSECGQARAAPTFKQSENGGQCQLPPPNIGTASLSLSAFNGGARCGECFQLTGPLGSTVVMVTDGCNAGDACVQNDLFNFIISNKDFDKIGNSSSYSNIFSLGYQEVSCGFPGNIKATFGGSASLSGKVDYNYYFTVAFSNFNIGIKQVQILGTGMTSYMKLKRSLGGFTWNQESGGSKLSFPATLVLTGVDGQTISYKFKQPPAGQPIDIKKQFIPLADGVARFNQSATCGMGNVPEFVFQDSLTFGWIVSNSWRFNLFNLSSQETDDNPALNENVIKMEMNGNGGLSFTREGGFQTKYLQSLEIMIKVAPPTSSLQTFFGASGIYVIPGPLGEDWTEVSIPMSVLKPQLVEYSLSFYNNQGQTITIWIDNIRWIFSADAPPTPSIVTDNTIQTPQPQMGGIGGSGAAVSSIGITSNKGGLSNLDASNYDDYGSEEENKNGGTGGTGKNTKPIDETNTSGFLGGETSFGYYNNEDGDGNSSSTLSPSIRYFMMMMMIFIFIIYI